MLALKISTLTFIISNGMEHEKNIKDTCTCTLYLDLSTPDRVYDMQYLNFYPNSHEVETIKIKYLI